MKELTGVGVALVTPFDENFKVDFEALTKLVEYNIAGGVQYLVVLGTTGEYPTLSAEEQKQVTDHIVKVNNGRLPLVLGIGGNNTQQVADKIRSTDTSAFTAILSSSPYYNKPSQEGLYQHYKALAATGKNIIMYNVPSRTGKNMEAATTIRIASEFSNIVMIKEASGDINQYFDILRQKPEGFNLTSGADEYALAVTLGGAAGVISVLGQAYPKAFAEMIALGREGKAHEAYAIQHRFFKMIQLIFAEGNPTGVKFILSELGIIKNYLRLPLIGATPGLEEKIRAEMKKLKDLQ